jgi:hypothetical protein
MWLADQAGVLSRDCENQLFCSIFVNSLLQTLKASCLSEVEVGHPTPTVQPLHPVTCELVCPHDMYRPLLVVTYFKTDHTWRKHARVRQQILAVAASAIR